eukprot:GILK01011312.1.p1 GENE.GILK01011312.1~~GILK01011312.1.p1  ORF type:complete len:1063 (+),score=190.52 GILK01011312.1:181-3369(+)
MVDPSFVKLDNIPPNARDATNPRLRGDDPEGPTWCPLLSEQIMLRARQTRSAVFRRRTENVDRVASDLPPTQPDVPLSFKSRRRRGLNSTPKKEAESMPDDVLRIPSFGRELSQSSLGRHSAATSSPVSTASSSNSVQTLAKETARVEAAVYRIQRFFKSCIRRTNHQRSGGSASVHFSPHPPQTIMNMQTPLHKRSQSAQNSNQVVNQSAQALKESSLSSNQGSAARGMKKSPSVNDNVWLHDKFEQLELNSGAVAAKTTPSRSSRRLKSQSMDGGEKGKEGNTSSKERERPGRDKGDNKAKENVQTLSNTQLPVNPAAAVAGSSHATLTTGSQANPSRPERGNRKKRIQKSQENKAIRILELVKTDEAPSIPPSGAGGVHLLRVLLDTVGQAEEVLGHVDIEDSSSLGDVRAMIDVELDGVPQDYVFWYRDAPVGRNQEQKRLAFACMPSITIRSKDKELRTVPDVKDTKEVKDERPTLPLLEITNDASISTQSSSHTRTVHSPDPFQLLNGSMNDSLLMPSLHSASSTGSSLSNGFDVPSSASSLTVSHLSSSASNLMALDMAPCLGVLYSIPLVYRDEHSGALKPIVAINYEAERDMLCRVLEESGKQVKIRFDFATTDRLRTLVTLGCRVLHYSGHANPTFVSFEDGSGEVQFVSVETLQRLFAAGSSKSKPWMVFVSACSSRLAGEAFAKAGVKHVVAVELETAVLDRTALTFTRAFYLALLRGETVKGAFEIGREAVSAAPNSSAVEAGKFLLLPRDGSHDVSIFDDVEKADHWQEPPPLCPDPLPAVHEGFVGRNVDMFLLIKSLLHHRLVTLCGPTGSGKTALAIAVSHYMSERRCFPNGVRLLRIRQKVWVKGGMNLAKTLLGALARDEFITTKKVRGNRAQVYEHLFAVLRPLRCLLVLDSDTDDAAGGEFQELLSHILEQTKTTILLVANQPMGANLKGVAEKIYKLGPLSDVDAAKLFLKRAPRALYPTEVRFKAPTTLLEHISKHKLILAQKGIPSKLVLLAVQLQFKTLVDLTREYGITVTEERFSSDPSDEDLDEDDSSSESDDEQ